MNTPYIIESEVWLPRPREEVFAFFADAFNLQELTPPWLNFRILTPTPIDMRQGALIDYRIRLYGLPVGWRTEITEWEPPRRFVDTQLNGPYRLWRHEHTFTEQDGGTLVADRVEYVPRGGRLVQALFVRRDLERIFSYRASRLRETFPSPEPRLAG
jgi:ligand-binding SRPBCC domain-containing protein